MSRMVSFAVLVGVIAVIGFLFYRVISGFLLPMFLAALLVVIFHAGHQWFIDRCGGRMRLAAVLTSICAVAVVVVPAGLLVRLAGWELPSRTTGAGQRASLHDTLLETLADLRTELELDVQFAPELRYIQASLNQLREQASAGALMSGDKTPLDKLKTELDTLEAKLAEGRYADKAESLHDVTAYIVKAQEDDKVQPGTLEYQTLLDDADRDFRRFTLELFGNSLRAWLADALNPTDDQLREYTGQLTSFAPGLLRSVGGKTGTFIGNMLLTLVITVIALYFFLADGPRMVRTVMRLSPLDDQHEAELVSEFNRISRAVVLATILSAVAQGLLAGVAFGVISLFVDDFNVVFSLTLLTSVMALIPFVGAAAVWVPTALWLFFHGAPDNNHPVWALALAVYGAGVISMADNLIKPLVLHGQSNLHPLLALLSVLGGVQALGPIGILVGPMVVVFLQTLLNILHSELVAFEQRGSAGARQGPLPFILSLRQRRLRLRYASLERIHSTS